MSDPQPTASRIRRAALTVFLDKGLDGATVRDIAGAAGLSEGALYRHFVSKDEIARSLFQRQHEALADLIGEAAAQETTLAGRVRKIVHAYCSAADEDWELFAFHLLNQHLLLRRIESPSKSPVDAVKALLQQGMRNGEIEAGDAEILTASVLGIVMQPAIHKAYGRWQGRLCDHAPGFVRSICRLLNIHADEET